MEIDNELLSTRIAQLFAENSIEYEDVGSFLSAIKERFGNESHFENAKLLNFEETNTNEGELVRFCGIVQNVHGWEFFASRYSAETKNGECVEATGAFSDPTMDFHRFESIDVKGPNAQRMVYNFSLIPGISNWSHIGCYGYQKDNETSQKLITVRTYDLEAEELKVNTIVQLYGVYYGPRALDSNNEFDFTLSTVISSPNIHVIEYRILSASDLIPRHLSLSSIDTNVNDPLRCLQTLAKCLMGSDTAAFYFLGAMVAKTYSRREELEVPLCSLPVAFLNVKESRSIIGCIRLLNPLVQVLPITKSIIENEQIFPVMNHDTGRLNGGRLQMAPGTVLILDFTQYKDPAVPTDTNHVQMNSVALRCLINEQKILYDFGVSVHRLDTEIRVIALVPPPYKIVPLVKFPAMVPLTVAFSDGIDPAHELSHLESNKLAELRWFLAQAHDRVQNIAFNHDIQAGVVSHFTGIRTRLSTEAPEHFRHLLSLARIKTALEGEHELRLETFESLLEPEYMRLTALALMWR